MTKIYTTIIIAAVAWCATAKADLMQDYNALVEFARRNVQYEKKQKKLQTLDEDIYSAILEYYNGSNDTTESEELLQLPSDGDQ
tara:strand:- start:548 stop:799 length:252 start_codon:yes stop_codon:yes gene_type:complete